MTNFIPFLLNLVFLVTCFQCKESKEEKLWSWTAGIWFPAVGFSSCMTLGKFLRLAGVLKFHKDGIRYVFTHVLLLLWRIQFYHFFDKFLPSISFCPFWDFSSSWIWGFPYWTCVYYFSSAFSSLTFASRLGDVSSTLFFSQPVYLYTFI